MSHFEDVKRFQTKIGFPEGSLNLSNVERVRQRVKLIAEEFGELVSALGFDVDVWVTDHTDPHDTRVMDRIFPAEIFKSKTNILKELCDLAYVVEGTAVELGFNYDEARSRVSANNLEKVSGDMVMVDGKVQKPANYKKVVLDDLI